MIFPKFCTTTHRLPPDWKVLETNDLWDTKLILLSPEGSVVWSGHARSHWTLQEVVEFGNKVSLLANFVYEARCNGDPRKEAVAIRLASLSREELLRIVTDIDSVCFDTFNYDPASYTFCPLAVAKNLHNLMEEPTDQKVHDALSTWFKPVNILKGVPGKFYTTNRRADLLSMCKRYLGEPEDTSKPNPDWVSVTDWRNIYPG